MHPNIKFTMETSNEKVPFLDVSIILKENPYDATVWKIVTDIYNKPTDTFNYFPFDSCGPGHIKRNIPYALARRIAVIVSEKQNQNLRYKQLYDRLRECLYPPSLIEDSQKWAKSLDRETILNGDKRPNKEQNSGEKITLVIDHDPNFVDPSNKIKQICEEMKNTEVIKSGKRKMPQIITARRQPPNLRRKLSLGKRNDHTSSQNSRPNFVKCTDKRCTFCSNTAITDNIYSTRNNSILKRNKIIGCKTRDLLYLLICDRCKKEYVGETGCGINERTNLHRSQIKNEKYAILKVSKHVRNCGNKEFKIFPFFKCNKNCHFYREALENKFRATVQPELH